MTTNLTSPARLHTTDAIVGYRVRRTIADGLGCLHDVDVIARLDGGARYLEALEIARQHRRARWTNRTGEVRVVIDETDVGRSAYGRLGPGARCEGVVEYATVENVYSCGCTSADRLGDCKLFRLEADGILRVVDAS